MNIPWKSTIPALVVGSLILAMAVSQSMVDMRLRGLISTQGSLCLNEGGTCGDEVIVNACSDNGDGTCSETVQSSICQNGFCSAPQMTQRSCTCPSPSSSSSPSLSGDHASSISSTVSSTVSSAVSSQVSSLAADIASNASSSAISVQQSSAVSSVVTVQGGCVSDADCDPDPQCEECTKNATGYCIQTCSREYCVQSECQPSEYDQYCPDANACNETISSAASSVTTSEPSQQAICGNGTVEQHANGTFEECDEGAQNGKPNPNTRVGSLSCPKLITCNADCKKPRCGDGYVNHINGSPTSGCPYEQCDDSNTESNDGCSSQCLREWCGDGKVQKGLGEQCDRGNEYNGTLHKENTTPTCRTDCSIPVCGDGKVEFFEECDCGDGELECTTEAYGKQAGCSQCNASYCGDGIVQEGEECDLRPICRGVSEEAESDRLEGRPCVSERDALNNEVMMERGDAVTFADCSRNGGTCTYEASSECDTECKKIQSEYEGSECDDNGVINCLTGAATSPCGKTHCQCDWLCPADAQTPFPVCGDGTCEAPESEWWCPEGCTDPDICGCRTICEMDCGVTASSSVTSVVSVSSSSVETMLCGNGICEEGEANKDPCANLPSDIVCGAPITWGSCPEDCVTSSSAISHFSSSSMIVAYNSQTSSVQSFASSSSLQPTLTSEHYMEYTRSSSERSVYILAEKTHLAAGSLCGDGVKEKTEECDDGNRRSGDGCSEMCQLEEGVCGDGIVQELFNEQCEPELHDPSLPFSCKECRYTFSECGNGTMEDGEECDNGDENANEPDASCRLDCSIARCGDGIQDSIEECDDANRIGGDGCNQFCLLEQEPVIDTPPPEVPQLPLAQLQPMQVLPFINPQAPLGETGPAVVVVIGAGAAAGWSYMRRKRRK